MFDTLQPRMNAQASTKYNSAVVFIVHWLRFLSDRMHHSRALYGTRTISDNNDYFEVLWFGQRNKTCPFVFTSFRSNRSRCRVVYSTCLESAILCRSRFRFQLALFESRNVYKTFVGGRFANCRVFHFGSSGVVEVDVNEETYYAPFLGFCFVNHTPKVWNQSWFSCIPLWFKVPPRLSFMYVLHYRGEVVPVRINK